VGSIGNAEDRLDQEEIEDRQDRLDPEDIEGIMEILVQPDPPVQLEPPDSEAQLDQPA
jgi:hypothetical protein